MPTLLLGLGTALVVMAAIVFAAVSWSRLGATLQGLVLLGLTGTAVWATRALRRRGLAATAEAVSVVAVALLPVDVEALREAARAFGLTAGPGGDPLVYWCLAIWMVAGVCWWFGRFSDTRAPRILAAVAAQVPLPLFVLDRPVGGAAGQLLCLAQAAIVLVACRRAERAVAGARTAGIIVAAATWIAATSVAAGEALDGGAADRLSGAGVVGVAAAIAALVAALWAHDQSVRSAAAGAATGVGLAAVGLAISTVATGNAWWPAAAGVCVAAVAVAVRVPRAWGDAPARVAGTLAAALSLPLVAAVSSAVAVGVGALDQAWRHDATTTSLALADGITDWLTPGAVIAHLAVAAAALAAVHPRAGRRTTGVAATAVGVAAVAVAPVLVDVPLAGVVGGLVVAAYAPMLWLAPPGGTRRTAPVPAPVALAAVTVLSVLALAWAAAAPATTVAAVAAVGVLAGWLAALALRDGNEPLAHGATMTTVVAVVAEAGLAAAALGSAPATAWAVAALAAAAASAAVAGLDPAGTRPDGRGRVALGGELTAAALHVLAACAVAGLADPALVTVVLATGAGAAAVHALRPGRRLAAVWAIAESLVLVWQRLAVAEVSVPEAYTLPVAVALLAAALVARRLGHAADEPSWTVHGPWLVAAIAPTVLLAVDDPGFVRPLGGLVTGVVVLVVGAMTRTRAAVDVGAVTVVALGLRQLSPVIAELPNWATLGTCGLVLLAVGATFEERRRDLGTLLDRYAQLS